MVSSMKLFRCAGVRRAVLAWFVAGWSCLALAQAPPDPDGDEPAEELLLSIRTIEFPEQGSLGELRVRPWKADQAHRVSHLGAARGRVTIPQGQWVILRVDAAAVGDLSPLERLHHEDLQELDFKGTALTDPALAHVSSLFSLRRLDLSDTK